MKYWHGRQPSLKQFKPFGCLSYRLIRKELRQGKFEAVSRPGVLLGAEEVNHNFEILDLETNNIHVSHDVTFQPLVFPLKQDEIISTTWEFMDDYPMEGVQEPAGTPPGDINEDVEADQPVNDDDPWLSHQQGNRPASPSESIEPAESPEETSESDDETTRPPEQIHEPQQRRSTRERKPVDRYQPSGHNTIDGQDELKECFETMKPRAEPKSYKMAMKSADAKKWREACDKEMKNIQDMGVGEIVDRPTNAPVVGGRWHFKLKLHPDGSISKYKARYVAKGYTQTLHEI